MKKNAGLTLLEVLIASVILVAVVLMAMSVLLSSTSVATKGEIGSDVEERGRRLFGVLRDDMSLAQYNALAPTSTAPPSPPAATAPTAPTLMGYYPAAFNGAVGYRIPGVQDATGNAATVPSGRMVYGYNSPMSSPNTGFFQDLTCVIRFEADTVLKESASSLDAQQATDWGTPYPSFPVLTPPTPAQILNLDLNNDGDTSDTFVTGKIVRYIVAATSNTTLLSAHLGKPILIREVLSDNVIFRVAGNSPGQFNGDFETHSGAPNYTGVTSYSGVLFGFVDQSGVYNPATIQSNSDLQNKGRGLLVTVSHARPDDTGKAWIVRKNQLLIRFRVPQS